MKKILTVAACLLLVFFNSPSAQGQAVSPGWTPAISALKDLDLAECKTFRDGVPTPAVPDEILGATGLTPRTPQRWTAGRMAQQDERVSFQYLLALRRPISLGTIFVDGDVQTVQLLKADAPWPADPKQSAHWQTLDLPPRQGGARTIPLPEITATRAILFTETRQRGQSELRSIRLLAERVLNAAPWSLAYADREYVPPLADFAPHPASSIAAGKDRWENAGKNQEGLVAAPPVTDVSPSWFMLTWPEDQTLAGLWLDSNLQKFDVEVFVGPAFLNPRAGTAAEWRKIKEFAADTVLSRGRVENTRLLTFAPVKTRGVRLWITNTAEGPIARITALHALTLLGSRPIPPISSGEKMAPPITVPLSLRPQDNFTVMVQTPNGSQVRNVATRSRFLPDEASAGNTNAAPRTHHVGWDLKDESGQFVAPGKYKWSALAWPDLGLKYELTAYPNVSRFAPENSPWLNGHHGSGGWMADHTPPCSGCVAGDRVFLGSYVAESGVSLIECDLDGRKRWGYHSFAAWTGARFLAADQKTLYVAAPILNTSTESVWAVDLESKKVTNPLALKPTATRRRGLQGIAAHDGKLFMSVRGQESWLEGATSADDVDLAACVPLLPQKRKPRAAYEVVTDPPGDFLRLFRLTGTPPGGATQHTNNHLETQSSSAPSQHIVLAFHRPVPIGSIVFPVPQTKDVRLTLSVLKPSAAYPPNPEDARQWTPFADSGKQAWDVVAAPENTVTRALRITFAKGAAADDDPLANVLDAPANKKPAGDLLSSEPAVGGKSGGPKKTPGLDFDFDKPKPSSGAKTALGFGGDAATWRGRLEGMKFLRRRFANVTAAATVRVSSGKVAADGSWDAQRSSPLSEAEPSVYALEWKSPETLRGLAIREVDGAVTKIDVFTGPENGAVDITGDTGWENVAEYHQQRRNHHSGTDAYNATARYVDGYVDFGREIKTRAVRLRIVSQWPDKGPRGEDGVRLDLGAQDIDATRCRVYGVAAVRYIGGEPPIDSSANERLEIYDMATAKLAQEFPLPQPGEIACDKAGRSHALSGQQIVRVSPTGSLEPIVSDLIEPTDFCFDAAGQLYAFDNAPARRHIRVYDSAGKFVRSIGQNGGLVTGPWEPTRFGNVVSLDVDARGQLWAVEGQYHPKRVTVWTTDGKFQKELLGNTPYGGGGVLDPLDKTRLFYGPLEFEVDWQTGLSRIKHLHWLGRTPPGEVPIRIGERTYLVTRPEFQEMRCGIVYRYENGVATMAAALGLADAFEPLKDSRLLSQFGGRALTEHYFLWTDRNGDGEVQASEVQLTPTNKRQRGVTNFNRDLGVQFGEIRYVVKEILPNGVPVYEPQPLANIQGRDIYRFNDGTIYNFSRNRAQDAAFSPDGKQRWTFPNEGWGVQSPTVVKPYSPSQVVSQFGIVGHEVVPGDLGEIIVVHANYGAWNIWTPDGMLVGPIFRDLRATGSQPWSMTDHARGLAMNDVTAGQEHFHGYFCRTSDGKFYVVAGHNHISVLEVQGLDKFRRFSGEITVTAADIQRAQQWDTQREQTDLYARSPVLDGFRFRKPPEFDGKLTGFGPAVAELGKGTQFHLGYDDANLYVAFKIRDMGPLKNSGEQIERLFKTGAACDLVLSTDPAADPQRQAPQPGDIRVLLTYVNNKPVAVLYRAVVPGTPPEKAFRVTSPVGETVIDQVVPLQNVRMTRSGDANQYTLEAALPLSELGLRPTPQLRLKMDWGVIVSGNEGHDVLRRVYWANRAAQIVADAPSEARLTPHLWGHVLFHHFRQTADEKLAEADAQTGKPAGKEVKRDVTDILDDLKTPAPKKP